MPFSDFYLIFKVIFYLIKLQKGGELTAGDDVAQGPRRQADMARRSARGCDVALRPRGRAMAGPRGAQVALARVAGGQAGRVHVGARVGHHVAGGFASGGPTSIVGPGNIGGTVTL